jgi:hypothetical protein
MTDLVTLLRGSWMARRRCVLGIVVVIPDSLDLEVAAEFEARVARASRLVPDPDVVGLLGAVHITAHSSSSAQASCASPSCSMASCEAATSWTGAEGAPHGQAEVLAKEEAEVGAESISINFKHKVGGRGSTGKVAM